MKTIKQIADEIGVSKQAIYKRIKRPPLSTSLQGLTTTVDGKLTVLSDGEKLILQVFTLKGQSTKLTGFTVNRDNQVDSETTTFLKDNIAFLQAQLTTKDKQLEEKDRQIEKLTAALEHATIGLNAAQALHAGTIQKQLTTGNPEERPPIKNNILTRLFGRRKGNE